MKTIDCLCFGACVVDVIENTGTSNLGGDAANQAVLLKRLGFNSQLCAVTGKDDASDYIIQTLRHHHLSDQWIIQKPELHTTRSAVFLDSSAERSFQVSGCAHRMMRKEDFPVNIIKNCRALSLGSMFTLHLLEEDGLKEIVETAKKEKCLIFSDTSVDRHHKGILKVSEFLPYIDYFMPSYAEAQQLTGKNNPDEIADCLFQHGAKCVVLKLGSKGAILYRKDEKIQIPAYKASAINTTGAGDNFCAGFIASVLAGLTEKQALCNACWMGARAVEKHGTTETDISSLPYQLKMFED